MLNCSKTAIFLLILLAISCTPKKKIVKIEKNKSLFEKGLVVATIKGKKINNASEFSIFLLEEAHVATVTGEAFGSPNNIRISYAASKEEIKKAISRIQKAIKD